MAVGYTGGDPGKLDKAGGTLTGLLLLNDGSPAASQAHVGVHGVTAVNVLAYGADPTGVSDSTTAFQGTINALSAAASSAEFGGAGRGLMYVPPGDYRVGNLTWKSNIHLLGAGPRVTTLIPAASSGYVIDVSGLNNTTRMANVLIEGITIGPSSNATGGLNANRPTCGGINLRYSQWCSLRDVFIHNLAGVGVDLTSTYDLVTHNVHLLHTGTDYTTPALLMTGTTTDDATNATHHFGMRIERCPVMIYCTNGDRRPFNNQFVGCKFEWHTAGQVAPIGPAIWIEYAEQLTFDACHFVTDVTAYPVVRGGATSGTQSCLGLKFDACDWISPDRASGWAFDGTALCIDPEFVGGHLRGMAKGLIGVSGCTATIEALIANACVAPVVDMVGPTIVGSRFLQTSAVAGTNILRVSSRARVIGCHLQGVTSGTRPDGISLSNDSIVVGNLFDQLVVGVSSFGINAIVRENVLTAAVFTPFSGSANWQLNNSVQTAIHPSVTGSRGGNAALASLLTALANQGLIVDSTTA